MPIILSSYKESSNFRDSYDKWLAYSKTMLSPDAVLTANTYEANLQGKQMMDDIRRQMDELMQAEYELRDERVRKSSDLDKLFFGSLIGLTVLLGTTVVLFTRRQLLGLSGSYEEVLKDAREKAAQVKEQREWFSTTLRSIGDAVIATDEKGKVSLMNEIACELTGSTEEEARGHDLQEIFKIVNQDTREVVENPVSKVRRLNKVVGLANHTVLISKNGKGATTSTIAEPRSAILMARWSVLFLSSVTSPAPTRWNGLCGPLRSWRLLGGYRQPLHTRFTTHSIRWGMSLSHSG